MEITKKNETFHNRSIENTLEILKSQLNGLSQAEIQKRSIQFGYNEIQTQKRRSKSIIFLEQFNNPIVYILFIAALISLVVGKVINLFVILVIIFVNGLIGFYQEVKAEKALNSLQNLSAPEATVLRECESINGCTQYRIKSREIVPGDIIFLESGDKVPADARLFEAINLQIDEAILTGESLPVRKIIDTLPNEISLGDKKNIAFSGTIVSAGRGKAIVFATGMQTEMGKIAQLINQTEEIKSPLEKRVAILGKKLGLLAIGASLLTFLLGIIKGFQLLEMFIFAVATLVSSIPSGLPAIITITLSIGVSRMVKRNAIIRKINAIDSLGAITAIVSDKTGTLTQNQMTVRKIFVGNSDLDVTGIGYSPTGSILLNNSPVNLSENVGLNKLLECAILCNDSNLRQHEISDNEYKWEIVGDPTEGALVVVAGKIQLNKQNYTQKYPRIDEIPFDSKNKYMITIHAFQNQNIICMKGAPEIVLNACGQIQYREKKIPLDNNEKNKILNQADTYASLGYRVLGFAALELKESDPTNLKSQFLSNKIQLHFLGLVGIIDPPREEVKEAIQRAKTAGIKIYMATGDHKLTASAIGKEIGILTPEFSSISGRELDKIDPSKYDEVVRNHRIFARVSPEHKYQIVDALKRNGEIVAMTGDGANDAPALKNAEVGVAMGITGTDITKDAASMILTDDNFASIVNAVEEGRVVYENIKKGIKFLLTTNMGEIITILLSMLIVNSHTLVFTPIMILWVNLVTDGTLTVALASEPKESDVMMRPPKDPNEPLIDRSILRNILFIATIMAAGVLFIFNYYAGYVDPIRQETLGFTTLAILQIFNAITSRSRRESIFKIGFRSNIGFLYGLLISFSLQIMAVHLPFFNLVLETTPITFVDWIVILCIGSILLITDEIRKLIVRRSSNTFQF